MKKKFALILSLCIAALLFTGCGQTSELETPSDEPNEEIYYTVSFDAFFTDEDVRLFLLTEVWDDQPEQTEYNNMGCLAVKGQTVSEAFADCSYIDLEIVNPDGTFLGWMEYKQYTEMTTIDGIEMEMYITEKVSDTLYTTEEAMAKTVEDYSILFLAKWSDIDEGYYTENGY